MESGRDSSFWRGLAVAFGDGLAFGVGMKLSQKTSGSLSSRPAPSQALLSLSLGRLEQIEQRLERMERAPAAASGSPAAGSSPAAPHGGAFDHKVLEAVAGSVEARLKEQAAQVERRFTDLEAKIAVELQSLDRQDHSIASGAQGWVEETRRQFNEQIAAVGHLVEQDLAGLHNRVVSVNREFAEAVAGIVDQQVAAAVKSRAETLEQSVEQKAVEAARTTAWEGVADAVRAHLEPLQREAAAALEARMSEVERRLTASLDERLGGIEKQAAAALDAHIAEAEARAAASLQARLGAIERQTTDAINARVGEMEPRLTASLDDRLSGIEQRAADAIEGHVAAALDGRIAEIERQAATALDARIEVLSRQVAATMEARLGEAERHIEGALRAEFAALESELKSQLDAREAEIADLRRRLSESDRASMEFVLAVSDLCRRAAERAAAQPLAPAPEPKPAIPQPTVQQAATEPAPHAHVASQQLGSASEGRIEPRQSLSLDPPLPGFAQPRTARSWRVPVVSSFFLAGCCALLLRLV